MNSDRSPCFEVTADSSIKQGDIFFDIPIIAPTPNPEDYTQGNKIQLLIETFDVVVVSQTCDLNKQKIEYVTLCPHWPFSELSERRPEFGKSGLLGNIKKSLRVPRYYYMEECNIEGFERGESIVCFEEILRAPRSLLESYTGGDRIRLTTEFTYALMYSFGHFFIRPATPD